MKYMFLIYHDEDYWAQKSAAEMQPVQKLVAQYIAELKSAGILCSCGPLKTTTTATTLRRRQGKLTVTDGPFAETREQLGGYFIVEAPNLDEALRWAGRWPNLDTSSMEIRPVTELSGLTEIRPLRSVRPREPGETQ